MMLIAIVSSTTVMFGLGILTGIVLLSLVAAAERRWRRPSSLAGLLQRHFGYVPQERIEVQSHGLNYRMRVDVYGSVVAWVEAHCRVHAFLGVPPASSFMESVGLATLLASSDENFRPSPVDYDFLDVGEEQPGKCVKHALWLLSHGQDRLALLWTTSVSHTACGFETRLQLELASLKDAAIAARHHEFFRYVEQGVQKAATYRGKILSLEVSQEYLGRSGGLLVHRLRPVQRDDVILPEATVRLLERNVIRFVAQRRQLAQYGMPVKKGLLFYGPPGTGKTHTIHYLIGALAGHTTLLVTAEELGRLDEYITLARLLQPSLVVIEDADLIGRERNGAAIGREALLNRLLNEMDGLRADAEILFLLTTNRPEALEPALAARPGRVDQAIEFPLPDESGRRKLIRLYAGGVPIAPDVVEHSARITQGVSASFIKELMRRALQFHLECHTGDGGHRLLQNDIDQAIDELLFIGGSLNRTLLGADGSDREPYS